MRYLSIILIVLLMSTATAIKITEIELNPSGDDSGNEWVEFYCKKKTDLSDYRIVNNDGDELDLSGECRGYFVHTFKKQWLDNSDEKVYLYKGDEEIDKTGLLKDDKNNDKAWSLCSIWDFIKSTKDGKNKCISGDENTDDEVIKDENDVEENKQEPQNIELEPISLEPKDVEEEKPKSKNHIYVFMGVCILLVLLFLLRWLRGREF